MLPFSVTLRPGPPIVEQVINAAHDIDEVERLADWVGFIATGRLVFAEPVASLLDRCRLVEVVTPNGAASAPTLAPAWLLQGVAGRTIRFVDTRHDEGARHRIAAAFPGADVRVGPLSLREIFVALARQPAATGTAGVEAV